MIYGRVLGVGRCKLRFTRASERNRLLGAEIATLLYGQATAKNRLLRVMMFDLRYAKVTVRNRPPRAVTFGLFHTCWTTDVGSTLQRLTPTFQPEASGSLKLGIKRQLPTSNSRKLEVGSLRQLPPSNSRKLASSFRLPTPRSRR